MEFLELLIDATGWTLLHFLWQGFLIGLLHEVALWLTATRSPQLRYAISLTGLMALAVVPLVTFVMLWNAIAMGTASSQDSVAPAFAITANPISGPMPTQPAWLETWLMYVVLAWLVGVASLSARFGLGVLSLRRLIQLADFDAVDERLRIELQRLQQHMGVTRQVRLALSTRVASPMVVGLIRPIIFLPLSAATGLDHQQIRMVLAHELAHLRRHDPLVNLVQVILETLFFYHPAVYRLSRSLRQEREQCCDDLAVAVGGNAFAYARVLAELETMRQNDREPVLALGIVNQELYARVERLVTNQPVESSREGWLPILVIALGGLTFAGNTLDFNARLLPPLFEQAPKRQRLPLALPTVIPRSFAPISAPLDEQAKLKRQAENAGEEAATSRAFPEPTLRPEQEKNMAAPQETEQPTTLARKTTAAPAIEAETSRAATGSSSASQVAAVSAGGELLKVQQPDYPRQALRAGTEGWVQLTFTITAEGRVNEIEVVESKPRGTFDRAAIEAVSSWQYRPFTENGEPVAKRASQVLEFQLSQNPQQRGGTSSRDCREQTGTRLCRAADDVDTQLTILRN